MSIRGREKRFNGDRFFYGWLNKSSIQPSIGSAIKLSATEASSAGLAVIFSTATCLGILIIASIWHRPKY